MHKDNLIQKILDIKKPTIFYTSGLPGCGKSTLAKEIIEKSGYRFVGVTRDDLRKSLGGPITPKDGKDKFNAQEKVCRGLRDEIVKSTIKNLKTSVIVHDTNILKYHHDHFTQLGKELKCPVQCLNFFTDPALHVTVEECISRDVKRGVGCVGKDVILSMYYEYLKELPKPQKNITLPKAQIIDLDGTLAINQFHGRWYDHNRYPMDKPQLPVLNAIKALAPTHKILIVSGREGFNQAKVLTYEWVKNQLGTIPFELFMRKESDMRPDHIIKREIYENEIIPNYNAEFVFDDRPCVVREWRSMGLFVFDCGNGIEF